jgi:hypothetical protein
MKGNLGIAYPPLQPKVINAIELEIGKGSEFNIQPSYIVSLDETYMIVKPTQAIDSHQMDK